MTWPQHLLRFLRASLLYAFVGVVVLWAVAFGVIRLLLPYADYYREDASAYASQYLGQQLQVESLNAEWHGWGPSLVFDNVALLDPQGQEPMLRFQKVRLGLDPLASLAQWQLVFSRITLVGARLVVTRNADRQFSLEGFTDSSTDTGSPQSDAELQSFTSWLFSQGQIRLEDSAIIWHDRLGKERVMEFSPVNLTLWNEGDQHVLEASVALPRHVGHLLQLHVEMNGDPSIPEARKTSLYVAGEQLKLRELLPEQWFAGLDIDAGTADFQAWARWDKGVLQQLQGSIDTRQFSVNGHLPAMTTPAADSSVASVPPALDLQLSRLAGRIDWQRQEHGWQFDADQLILQRPGHDWQPTRAALHYIKGADGAPVLDAYLGYFQIDLLAQLVNAVDLGTAEAIKTELATLQPQGEILDASLRWTLAAQPDYQLYARLRDAGSRPLALIPESRQVNGQLWLTPVSGVVELERGAVVLDFPELFRGPIPVDELQGRIAWALTDTGWSLSGRHLVASNRDISLEGLLDITRHSSATTPFIAMIVNFADGDGGQVARYLPAGIMTQSTVDWLDAGVLNARVVAGGAIFHGYLDAFPFDHGEGRFEVQFQVEDGELNYAPDWPVIRQAAADVRFLGRSMRVEAHRGAILSNEIQWANASIDDLNSMPLLIAIEGEVQGSTQDKLRYLSASPPLVEQFGDYTSVLQASGDSLLHLQVDLSIDEEVASRVNGWVTLQDNTLEVEPLGQVLSDINGRLSFTDSDMQADAMDVRLFGQPTQLVVRTDRSMQNHNVRIATSGRFDAQPLLKRVLPDVGDRVTGSSLWDMALMIPLGTTRDTQHVATFSASSDLRGTTLRLPPPFGKQPGDAAGLALRVDIDQAQPAVLAVSYKEMLSAHLQLGSEDAAAITRGEVRINRGVATLPRDAGLRVFARLDNFALADWDFLHGAEQAKPVPAAPRLPAPLAGLKALELSSGSFSVLGQTLHNLELRTQGTPAGLRSVVKSEELQGEVMIPANLGQQPVEANLARWSLAGRDTESGDIDPRMIPALKINVEDFRYKDKLLGNLRLGTTRIVAGMRIDQLVVKPKSTTITLRGGWLVGPSGQQSNVLISLDSADLGETLTSLGYVGAVDDGKGTLEAELNWADAITAFSTEKLNGRVTMLLSDGQLLDIDPGAGKIFSLLSLQALPRRLLLDFSDVFAKGLEFSKIKGSFTITRGNAVTRDFYLDGPPARIDITGRIGLAAEDYDQVVTITPHISDTLPVLGALAATPQVGAVILFAQKLFKLEVGKVTQTQYSVTGNWSNPVISKLKNISAPETEKQ